MDLGPLHLLAPKGHSEECTEAYFLPNRLSQYVAFFWFKFVKYYNLNAHPAHFSNFLKLQKTFFLNWHMTAVTILCGLFVGKLSEKKPFHIGCFLH